MSQGSLFLSAGDLSGDIAAARVIEQVRQKQPDLEISGLGGPKLFALGQRQLAKPSDLHVLGFWEVARRVRFFSRLLKQAAEEIKRCRPSCLLLVDYPGFNLRLAQRIKSLGIPIVYYISPQVWAWGRRRVKILREVIDRLLVILPFEQQFLQQHNVTSTYVGHYLLEDIPTEYIASPISENNRLALLPGSRPQEIARMLKPMLETAMILHQSHKSHAVVAAIRGAYDYESLLSAYNNSAITIEYDDARRVVHASDLVLTASGTATLECGLIGRPMVVIYKTGWLSYQIARRLVKLDSIALVNLALGQQVVPELIQHQARPKNIAHELERYFVDRPYRDGVVQSLHQLSNRLGGTGSSARVAEILQEYL